MNSPRETTLITGTSICAEQVAVELAAVGNTQLLIVTEDDNFPLEIGSEENGHCPIEVLTNTRINACNRTETSYRLDLTNGSKTFSRAVSNIVVAHPELREANYTLNHLKPSKSVVPLSRMTHSADDVVPQELINPKDAATTIVFLSGLFAESNPLIAADVMSTALQLQTDAAQDKKGVQTYILTKNLKVASNGLEALYRESKQAGTVYIKFTDTVPDIRQNDDAVIISFTDEITGLPFTLTPQITVVDETILPSEKIDGLAASLCLEMDAGGFAQADNVHRQTVLTNQHCIFATGPSRNIMSPDDQRGDASNAALAVTAKGITDPTHFENKASIDTGACVRCLTCYRLCPHKAIFLEVYPTVIQQACERCGICAAECPQHAIVVPDLKPQEIANRIGSPAENHSDETFIPNIVAFCCSRSASQAANLATLMGNKLTPGLKIIEIPCAGAVSVEYIFAACLKGADGILILTCHEGNCHSSRGNTHARNRVLHFKEDTLAKIGYDTERLEIQTLASNMGVDFANLTHRFVKKIKGLGPIR